MEPLSLLPAVHRSHSSEGSAATSTSTSAPISGPAAAFASLALPDTAMFRIGDVSRFFECCNGDRKGRNEGMPCIAWRTEEADPWLCWYCLEPTKI